VKLPRRRFLYLAGAAALPTLPRVASALDYPTRLVHIIVGYAPDGATDIMARVMGQWLSEPRQSRPQLYPRRRNAASSQEIDSKPRGGLPRQRRAHFSPLGSCSQLSAFAA